MEIGTMLGDAFEYTKEALVDKWMRWLILIIGSIIFPITLGYTLRVYRGEPTPPDPQDWVAVFIDGIKLFIVELIWALPVIIVAVIVFGGSAALLMSGSDAATAAGVGGILLGILLVLVVGIIVSLFAAMGAVRFARTDSFGEAFNFSAILAHIGRIGWGPMSSPWSCWGHARGHQRGPLDHPDHRVAHLARARPGLLDLRGPVHHDALRQRPGTGLNPPLFSRPAAAFRHPEVLSRRGSAEATLMEIGTMLGDAYEYTKEALVGHWMRWLILLVGTIIFPIILGYTVLVYRGDRTPPDPQDWVAVFVDGIKLFVVQLIYALPVIVINLVMNMLVLLPVTATSGPGGTPSEPMSGALVGAAVLIFVVLAVVSILVSLISMMASVRFARTDSIGEAFNFSAILAHIGRIGWGSYIIALIVLYVALFTSSSR